MSFELTYLEAAHEHCFGNEPEVRASEQACCIACAKWFQANRATEAMGEGSSDELTVFCPVCGFDTIVGDASGYPVGNVDFIVAMNHRFFKEPLGSDAAWKEFLNAQN